MPAKKGVPHKKLTSDQKKEAEQRTIELLAKGTRTGEVKRIIEEEFGIKRRSVEPYLRRAREAMRAETGKSVEDLRAESYAFYQSILASPDVTAREKIKARERIDKLLGLDKPVMIHNKNLNLDIEAEDIQGMTDDELADFERRLLGES